MADDNYGVLEEQLPPIPISPDCEGVDTSTLNSLWEQEAIRLAQYIEKKSFNTEVANESYANGESSLGEVFISDDDEVPTGDLLQLDTHSSIKPNRTGVTQQLREMFGFENPPPPSSRPDRCAGATDRLRKVTKSVGTYSDVGEPHGGDGGDTKVSTESKSLNVSGLAESNVRGVSNSTRSNVRGVSKSTGNDVRGVSNSTGNDVRGVSKYTGSDVRGVSKSTGNDVGCASKSTGSNVRGVSKSTGNSGSIKQKRKPLSEVVSNGSRSTLVSPAPSTSKVPREKAAKAVKSMSAAASSSKSKQKTRAVPGSKDSQSCDTGNAATSVTPRPKPLLAASCKAMNTPSRLKPPSMTDSATPAGKPPARTLSVTPGGKPPSRTLSATSAGKPPARTLLATPVGKPPARTLLATPVGKPPARTCLPTPAGKPSSGTLSATPAGRSSANHARHNKATATAPNKVKAKSTS